MIKNYTFLNKLSFLKTPLQNICMYLIFDQIFVPLNFRRAKEKRLKKDAGRSRWSQYFRTMKGSISPRNDKDDLKVDLDSNFSHSHGKFINNNIFYKPLLTVFIMLFRFRKQWQLWYEHIDHRSRTQLSIAWQSSS